MIKSGAHRISPKEIEEVILEMHEVHEVGVVASQMRSSARRYGPLLF